MVVVLPDSSTSQISKNLPPLRQLLKKGIALFLMPSVPSMVWVKEMETETEIDKKHFLPLRKLSEGYFFINKVQNPLKKF